jgi:hypothetical protein
MTCRCGQIVKEQVSLGPVCSDQVYVYTRTSTMPMSRLAIRLKTVAIAPPMAAKHEPTTNDAKT